MISESTLTYQVYVAPIIAMAGKDVPPGQRRSTWSPVSATLISGRQDAVRDFDRLDKETATAEDLYWQMLAIHPDRVNPGALWLSAQSAKA